MNPINDYVRISYPGSCLIYLQDKSLKTVGFELIIPKDGSAPNHMTPEDKEFLVGWCLNKFNRGL